jgi:aminoglycoside 6'-N-acetyltransferase
MTVGRRQRRAEREPRFREVFGADTDLALDALELTELAWHDCYSEVAPPDEVVDDILAVSGGTLPGLLRAAWLAVQDPRDLRLLAQHAPVPAGPAPELRGERVVLAPVTGAHVPELRRILLTPEVRHRWGDEAASSSWPFDDPSAVRFAVLHDGVVRGMVQYAEEDEPSYRHASIDIFLDPDVHGLGVGRDAVRTLARHLVHDRGHHRLVIDPAADNLAAVRSYAAVGFRPVGVMRRYERDVDGGGWHDSLRMDLLAEDLPPG